MKMIPVRVFMASHYVDVVMECDDEEVAHNGALDLVRAGKLRMKKIPENMKQDKFGTLLAITLPAKVKKVLRAPEGGKGKALVRLPGKGSDKIH